MSFLAAMYLEKVHHIKDPLKSVKNHIVGSCEIRSQRRCAKSFS